MWDDDNRMLANFCKAILETHPDMINAHPELIAVFRDGITALLEGVVNAPIMMPEEVVEGLEKVRQLPAAMGGDRTSLSFGPYDRKGHKGLDNMVVRRLKDGKLIMESRFEAVPEKFV